MRDKLKQFGERQEKMEHKSKELKDLITKELSSQKETLIENIKT
jgi:hypothetical protein